MAGNAGRRKPTARTRSARGTRGSQDAVPERSSSTSQEAREARARARADQAELEARTRAERAAELAAESQVPVRHPTKRAPVQRSVEEAPVEGGLQPVRKRHDSIGERPASTRPRRASGRRPTGEGLAAQRADGRVPAGNRGEAAPRRGPLPDAAEAESGRPHIPRKRPAPTSRNPQGAAPADSRAPRRRKRPGKGNGHPQGSVPADSPVQPGTRQPRPRLRRKGRIAAAVVVIVACAVGIGLLVSIIVGSANALPRAVPDEQPGITPYTYNPDDEEAESPFTAGETSVSLSAVGDNLLHLPVIDTADSAAGGMKDDQYDFSVLYTGLSGILATHDINFIDIETPLGGDDREFTGYPVFNGPSADATGVASAGFNLATTATNHAWDQGFDGIEAMSRTWSEHPEVVVAGTYTSQADRDHIRTFKKNGLTFAFLAYQDDLNGFTLPDDQQWAVADSNDKDLVRSEIRRAHELAEVVIVAMSWGDENSFEPNESQRETAQLFADEGVDLVLGFGPHVIQPVEWVTAKTTAPATEEANAPAPAEDDEATPHKTLVVYSLGNYVSNQPDTQNLVEGCFTCNIVRSEEGAISIADPTWTPLVGHFVAGNTDYGTIGHNAYPIYDYTEEMERQNYHLGSLDDPLEYVRNLTLEVIDPQVVTIDWDGPS